VGREALPHWQPAILLVTTRSANPFSSTKMREYLYVFTPLAAMEWLKPAAPALTSTRKLPRWTIRRGRYAHGSAIRRRRDRYYGAVIGQRLSEKLGQQFVVETSRAPATSRYEAAGTMPRPRLRRPAASIPTELINTTLTPISDRFRPDITPVASFNRGAERDDGRQDAAGEDSDEFIVM